MNFSDHNSSSRLNGSSHHSGPLIEIDVDLLSQPKAKRVKALHINERFMKTEMIPKRTVRELRKIFSDVQQLDATMETMHVQLDTTPLTGSILALAVTPRLQALHVLSGLLLANSDDRQAFGKVIYQHEHLTEITLHNLMVTEGIFARWRAPPPPLDILVPAFTAITFLNVLELSCSTEMEVPPPDHPPTVRFVPRPMLSMLAVKELVQSVTLQRLELSRLGLTDDHFGVIVEQMSHNSSCLTELILNENQNTDTGLDMLSSLLFKADCPLERLECYQSESVVVGTTVELLQQAMRGNTTLTNLRIHLWGDDDGDDGLSPSLGAKKSRIHFFTQLNKKGRKRLLDRHTTQNQWMDLIVDVKDDPSQLYYCLRNSSYWWKRRGIVKARPSNFVMPAPTPPLSPAVSSSTPRQPAAQSQKMRVSQDRLSQLKDRHSQLLDGLNLNIEFDDLSDIGEDEAAELDLSNLGLETFERRKSQRHLMTEDEQKDIAKYLESQDLPQFLELNIEESEKLHNSDISFGAQSYIQDLMHQKEKRPTEAREEVLEEALEELDYVTTHNKLPPGMSEELFFTNVLIRLSREKEKQEKERERKLNALLEKALVVEVEREKAAKEQAVNGKKPAGKKPNGKKTKPQDSGGK